jgi:two-component system, LytTR family, response regulator
MIYATRGLVVPTYESLQELEERLKDYHFFRCHRGFIINVDMVTEILPWGSNLFSKACPN